MESGRVRRVSGTPASSKVCPKGPSDDQSTAVAAPDRLLQHGADVVIGRDFADPEQRLTVRASVPFFQRPLIGQKDSLCRKTSKTPKARNLPSQCCPNAQPARPETRHRSLQLAQKGRQHFHPYLESKFYPFVNSENAVVLELLMKLASQFDNNNFKWLKKLSTALLTQVRTQVKFVPQGDF